MSPGRDLPLFVMFNGKRLSPAAVMTLVGGLMLSIRDSGVNYVGWRRVRLLLSDMLNTIILLGKHN